MPYIWRRLNFANFFFVGLQQNISMVPGSEAPHHVFYILLDLSTREFIFKPNPFEHFLGVLNIFRIFFN